jgi:transcription elongation factor Elf1
MGASDTVRDEGQSWESVHVCPSCGHVANLAELDMQAITTGIVTCPDCGWSGQIEIQVVDQVPRKKPKSVGS